MRELLRTQPSNAKKASRKVQSCIFVEKKYFPDIQRNTQGPIFLRQPLKTPAHAGHPPAKATEAVARSTLLKHKGQPQKLWAATRATEYISIEKSIKTQAPDIPSQPTPTIPTTCKPPPPHKAAKEDVDCSMLLQKGQPQKLWAAHDSKEKYPHPSENHWYADENPTTPGQNTVIWCAEYQGQHASWFGLMLKHEQQLDTHQCVVTCRMKIPVKP